MLMQTLRKGNHEACSRIPTITFIALRWMAEDRKTRTERQHPPLLVVGRAVVF